MNPPFKTEIRVLEVYTFLFFFLCFFIFYQSEEEQKGKSFIMSIFLKFKKKTKFSVHFLSFLNLSWTHKWKHEYFHIHIHTYTHTHTPILSYTYTNERFLVAYLCFQRLLSYGYQQKNILSFTDLS